MATPFQTILDNIARVVGGSLVDASRPGFYSGYVLGDGSGVAGIRGCYSRYPETALDTPVGMLIPRSFTNTIGMGGPEDIIDLVALQILVSRNDPQTQLATLATFRDSVPAAFRAQMQLGLSDVEQAFPIAGKQGVFQVAEATFDGWEFTIQVTREIVFSYTA